MFKWLFTKEHREARKAKENNPNGLSFWERLLNSLTYSNRITQRNYGSNSPNYNYAKVNQSGTNNIVYTETNGKEKLVVNGKELKPGTPEFVATKKKLDDSKREFSTGMENFAKEMEDFAKDMGNMFK